MSDIVVVDEIIVITVHSPRILSTAKNICHDLLEPSKILDCRCGGEKVGTARNLRKTSEGIMATITIRKKFENSWKGLFLVYGYEPYVIVYNPIEIECQNENHYRGAD